MSDAPHDLTSALKKLGLDGFFAECTPAHRREYLKWIDEAKKPETRQVRIEKTVQMLEAFLLAGLRQPSHDFLVSTAKVVAEHFPALGVVLCRGSLVPVGQRSTPLLQHFECNGKD